MNKNDLISRLDAIEAIFKVGHEHVEENVIPLGAVTDYSDAIKALPSAELPKGDLISRADALNLNCVITVRRADTKERKCDDEIIKACFEAYVEHIKKLPSAEQVTSKLKKHCNSLLTDDSEHSKEHKSKLDGDLINRADAIEAVMNADPKDKEYHYYKHIAVKILNALPSAEAVQGYTKWLEKIIVDAETLEWLCEDAPCEEWCDENCHYSSIQAECLRHLYEVSKGGDNK